MTATELFDAAVPALKREAARLAPSGLRWSDVVALVADADGDPVVRIDERDAALAFLSTLTLHEHEHLVPMLEQVTREQPGRMPIVLIGAFAPRGWHVDALTWSTIQ